MTADTSKSLDLHAHPEVGASPAASKDGKDADVVDSRTLAAIRCARRFIIGDHAYEIGQTDARLILDRLSRETARADAAEAEAKALREASERLANAADKVGVAHFDTDDMSDEVTEMQSATLALRATLAQPADGGK